MMDCSVKMMKSTMLAPMLTISEKSPTVYQTFPKNPANKTRVWVEMHTL